MSDIIVTVMEYIGTVAFALSGAIIGARYGLDLFGVVFVGCVTAVSGGIMRDVILGIIPPKIFSNPVLMLISAIVSLVVFVVFYKNAEKFNFLEKRIERINIIFDAVGLAAFSVIGVEASFGCGFEGKATLSVFTGVITAIGGGILRDLLVDKIPYVLKKHIYALAAIIGSIVYYYLRLYGNKILALIGAVIIIISIRLLAAGFYWKLPRITLESEENK